MCGLGPFTEGYVIRWGSIECDSEWNPLNTIPPTNQQPSSGSRVVWGALVQLDKENTVSEQTITVSKHDYEQAEHELQETKRERVRRNGRVVVIAMLSAATTAIAYLASVVLK